MYIAYSSIEDGQHHGSTKLHIDITDAINIMVWSSPISQQSDYALWRIFPQAASAAICEYSRNHAGPGHPIHSQTIYFTESMLAELKALYGVQPFTIKQRVGEAIFIPAGCAHQVRHDPESITLPLPSLCCSDRSAIRQTQSRLLVISSRLKMCFIRNEYATNCDSTVLQRVLGKTCSNSMPLYGMLGSHWVLTRCLQIFCVRYLSLGGVPSTRVIAEKSESGLPR